ncbi:hypothetical protein V1477_018754 [Vespula maculifrons]|uniref:Uncharacterized protein n=1 Tax=Vespula maculifrons TaxID=7453 RepID=A0ABD2AW94_VESMC
MLFPRDRASDSTASSYVDPKGGREGGGGRGMRIRVEGELESGLVGKLSIPSATRCLVRMPNGISEFCRLGFDQEK